MNQFSASDKALLELGCALRDANYQFTTVTPLTHERVNNRPENAWAKNLRDVFGWSRPFEAEILAPAIWDLMQRAEVARLHQTGWCSTVRLSSLAGQLFWHSAYPTTSADSVFFGPDTYRYANAIQHWLALNPKPLNRIVDIGSGAGPGAILCALAQPQAEVLAVDINDAALRLTRINAAMAEANNLTTKNSDLLRDVDGEFDLVIANPPYLVDTGERAYRHGGGPLGAGLSLAIVDAALERLSRGGTLLLYTGVAMMDGCDPFREEVKKRLESANVKWSYEESDPDVFGEELESGLYAQCDRIATVVLTATKQ